MTKAISRLKNFPIPWFATTMGLAGFTIAWSRAEHLFEPGFSVSPILLGLTAMLLARTALAVARREICVEGH
ncbi:MAG: hypothetical protein K8H75_11970 [Sulfuricella sp.]|nr:hypothetical protein [Sulfuricella sp.]